MSKNKKTKFPDIISTNKKITKQSPFYIVGIGASAGGLEALEQFFDNCPYDTGISFVVIQHLSPDYKSLMTELLSRHTKMEVSEAKNKEIVKPNHIYLIPRKKNLTIKHGKLILTNRPAKNQINFSIDIFFHSLAAEQKEMSIGIILSGTGSDGTRGGKSIKEVGGTIFVQNPESGRFDGMTRSAINHGLADYILAPEEMASELIQFVSHPHFTKTLMTGTELGKDIEAMDRVLKIIKNHTGYDFFSYKKPTLLRRTAKRMNITKCETIEDYIDYLYQTSEEKFIIVEEFLIGVTKFFRDSEAYDILSKQVIPDIVDAKKARKLPIKIWVVACSTGEEAYSIAILFEEYLERRNIKIPYKIFATDIDGKSIDIAARGIYSSNISLDISPQRLSKYFIKLEDKFQIQPNIRKNIIFSKHDILQHPPFNKMDLVSCRNMLIYIDNPIQVKILASLHYSLSMNGYLFMGSSESIGLLNKNFAEVSNKWKIYRNVHPTKMINLSSSNTWQVERNSKTSLIRNRNIHSFDDKVTKLINLTLMEEYDAVSVCIDKQFEIIHASGKFKKYVIMPEQGFSNNLLKLLPDQLSLPITSGIRRLLKTEDKTITKEAKLVVNDTIKQLKIIIQTANFVLSEPVTFLVTILDKKERILTPEERETQLLDNQTLNSSGLLEEVGELKEALNETRENLQATIEELETSNEEMQATNEELLASNEELQSTNEELQSLNEELHTVNAELQEKNVQLLELNSDIENLMININIGTIFLDRDLGIRKFTPAIKEHFQLRNEDIGRPIEHFSGSVGEHNLVKEAKKVLKTLKPFKSEFQNAAGLWFLLQIFPYRTQNDVIKGVVVNFINIHELKMAFNEKDKLNSYISHLANSSPVIIYVYDIQSRLNVFTTNSIYEIAGYSKKEITALGTDLLKSIVHPDDYPKILAHNKKLKTLKDEELAYIEYRLIHRVTRESIWILSTDKVEKRDDEGNVLTILGVAQNISSSKKMELQLATSEERARLALEGTNAGLWEWTDVMFDDAWWSKQFYKLLGYSPKNIPASFAVMLHFIHPDHVQGFQKELNLHFTNKTPFQVDLQIKTKRKGYRWFRINLQAQWDKDKKPKKVAGTLLDIDNEYKFKEVIQEKQKRLEAIYNSAPVGILLVNQNSKIVEASKGVTSILGYSNKELLGKHILDITYEDDKTLSKNLIKQLKEGNAPFLEKDKRYIAKDKRVFWGRIRSSLITISGTPYIVGILSDINESKIAENKMKQLNEELERFAYLASHDLKEPLRTITSLTERLTEKYGKKLDKGALQYIDFIENASSRMESLTSELLTYSQLGHKVKDYKKINLNKLIKQIKTNLHTSFSENKVTLEVAKLPTIQGDPTQIGLLLQNLISNSIKYRKKVAPKIQINYKDKGDLWEFSLKDNGIGIDKAYHEKIFEVFKRLHNKGEYEGTGIGLSNCKRIIENHKGSIWVKSTPRRGATFFFTIPKKVAK